MITPGAKDELVAYLASAYDSLAEGKLFLLTPDLQFGPMNERAKWRLTTGLSLSKSMSNLLNNTHLPARNRGVLLIAWAET